MGGRTILDLGCGPGHEAAELAAQGARVVGFDVNEDIGCAKPARVYCCIATRSIVGAPGGKPPLRERRIDPGGQGGAS